MKLINISIANYRNLDGIDISLDESCNFIVGENNLGKSNLLSLLNILFTSRTFRYEDFADPGLPINIKVKFKLADVEIGHFNDLFEQDDYQTIELVAIQANVDDNICFFHAATGILISPVAVKAINFIHYDSLRNPISEINFDKGKGVGKFLKSIIAQHTVNSPASLSEYLVSTKVDQLLQSINDKISKIKSFKDFGITASTDDDCESLLSKIVLLTDGKGDNLAKAGYGVQFLILVTLSILDKLKTIQAQRGERDVFEDPSTGEKSISLVLGLDEPEIHLHPYMQRSLIKYLNTIIFNQNEDFKTLIKELFDIDKFVGQIFVVTHSPNIILNDYKQIVRFYKAAGTTRVVSGSQLILDGQLHKHLYLNFPFIKEAFFAKAAIFVEGDSEYSSFPKFASRISIDFDDLGICILQARGDAISQLIELANKFSIPSVGITDRDDDPPGTNTPPLYKTTARDYEEEIISLIDSGNESVLRAILIEYDGVGIDRELDMKALNKRAYRKYNVVSTPFTTNSALRNIVLTDIALLKSYYITWFGINKSYPLGLVIGDNLTEGQIPQIYKDVILKAKELVDNA